MANNHYTVLIWFLQYISDSFKGISGLQNILYINFDNVNISP